MGSNPCPPPFLRKDRREVREDVQLPFLEEETPQLDAAKRKSLPAWIREGLEKMEREKLRRLERERAEAEHRERLSKKAQQDSDPLKSKFDSDSEDEKGEGVDMFSDGQRGRRSSPKRNGLQTARDASPDEEPLEPRTEEFRFRTAEERQQELMLKVRRMLTELLLEVTNEEVLSMAKEVLQKAIQKGSLLGTCQCGLVSEHCVLCVVLVFLVVCSHGISWRCNKAQIFTRNWIFFFFS
ncbi:unnamed protein product, partial [Ixodes pacificus]